ncbi:MAG: FAD-binding oxidoreductase [Anaerolineae bacterium]
MRRWNGWGDDTVEYPVPSGAVALLHRLLGPGTPPRDASLEQVLNTIPPSRLPQHPLISAAPLDRLQHARGQSLPDWIALRSGRLDAFPDGVAYPTCEDDVRQLLGFASAVEAQVIPSGGGTSVVGHINPLAGERPVLTIDMGRLNRLRHCDIHSGLATFEAGVAGPDLEAQLRTRGLTLGHYPQSFEYSTLGGWIATRSSGQQSLGYGRIERLFAGGRLVAPAGELVLPPFPASAAGPDLRELVLGSEGRLGVLTEATVRASRVPECEVFHAVFLPGWEQAQATVREIVQARLPLSLLRLSTPAETVTTLALAGHERLIGALERLLSLRGIAEGKCMLLVGFSGREAVVKTARREALGIASLHGGVHIGQTFGRQWHKTRFRTPYLRNTLWDLGYAIDTLETATDWQNIPALVHDIESGLRQGLQEIGERVHVFTHLSHLYPYGSSLYTTYLFRIAADPEETWRRWRVLKAGASHAIIARGATISHQHGVGLDHLPYIEAEKGPLGVGIIADILHRCDPQGIMNTGKMLGEQRQL